MKLNTINSCAFLLLCMTLISCGGMIGNKKKYSDSIVVTYYKNMATFSYYVTYDYMRETADNRRPTDTVEIPRSQFYALKARLSARRVMKKDIWAARIFMKCDTLAVCFSEFSEAIDKGGYMVDISQETLHEIMTLSKYYNYFMPDDLKRLPTIQKFGTPSNYRDMIGELRTVKIGSTRKVFLVPTPESNENIN